MNEMLTAQLTEVEREIAMLEAEHAENITVRRQDAAAKLSELRSADVTKMNVDEIIDHSGTVAALETLLHSLGLRAKEITNRLQALRRERMQLQESRVHRRNVEQFRGNVIQTLQSRRSDILAQLAKVDNELEKIGGAV